MDFSQKSKISIFWGLPRGKKTESIYEHVENINQEMKLFVDFFKEKIRSQFSSYHGEKESQFLSLKKTFNKSVSPLHFWKDVRS